MYKKVIYLVVDLRVDHLVEFDQCQCVANIEFEAHWRHIGLVTNFLQKVKEGIITAQTCTQVLQMFHKSNEKNIMDPQRKWKIFFSSSTPLIIAKDFDTVCR